MAAERRALPPAEFARERLGWWDEPLADVLVIPEATWNDLVDRHSQPTGRLVYAVDMTPDRSSTSIGVAGLRDDKRMHVEVIDHRAGSEWVLDRMTELKKHRPAAVVMDAAGPASSFAVKLEEIFGSKTELVDARNMIRACGAFYDMATRARNPLVHIGQPSLNEAVKLARKRDVGDGWAWERKGWGDISPLVAVTLAAWTASNRRGRGGVVNLADVLNKNSNTVE